MASRVIFPLLIAVLLLSACSGNDQPVTGYPSPPQTPDWAKNATIYEVNLRQYTEEGTFEAFAEHLPRLRDMGVDILWFMPIHPIGEKERKGSMGSYYSVYDYYGVNPEFGDKDDFRRMVSEIHDLGMYVILDWVANHTAWDAVWTETHPHLYETDDEGNFIIPPDTDWTDVIQLDYSLDETREMMHDALLYWVEEFNIDGYRCDVADYVPTDFWNEARSRLDAVKPVFMLAEAETPEHHIHAFDMSYGWETHHRMNELAAGDLTINEFEQHLEENRRRFPDYAYRMQFTSNHDENSWNGTVFERYGDGAETFAVLASTIPGMPLVYSGQEAAMDKRLEFFEKDPIEWGDYPLLDFYTRLLRLNQENHALFNGIHGGELVRVSTSEDDRVFAFYRQKEGNRVFTLLNLSDEPVTFDISSHAIAGSYTELFTDEQVTLTDRESWEMDSWGYRVYFY
ncbi:alpha-amylase family glycosyl hydrolase [Balneolales bacterium ANBcel1]|nr:alpha-amylase family glycosyl hydrolase [Balneolales bacterium ANBcel1]